MTDPSPITTPVTRRRRGWGWDTAAWEEELVCLLAREGRGGEPPSMMPPVAEARTIAEHRAFNAGPFADNYIVPKVRINDDRATLDDATPT